MSIRALWVVLLMLLPSAVFASTAEARKARDAGDFGKAWSILAPLAQKGDLNAMIELGDLMMMSSLPDKRERAIRFYRAAAERGSLDAEKRLRAINASPRGDKALTIPPGTSYQEFLAGRHDLTPEQVQSLKTQPYTAVDADFPADMPQPSMDASPSALVHVIVLTDAFTPLTDTVVELERALQQRLPGQVTFEWVVPAKTVAVRGALHQPTYDHDPTGAVMTLFGAKRLPIAVIVRKSAPSKHRLVTLGGIETAVQQDLLSK